MKSIAGPLTLTFCLVLTSYVAAYAQDTAPPQPGQLANPQTQPNGQQRRGLQNLSKTVSAPSFTVRDKFDYRIVQSFGARGLVGALFGAAIGQADDSPHEWGQGVHGFAERYGSGLAGNVSRQSFAFVLESAFHEDPRYFPSEDKTMKERALNALKQVIICKTDSGRTEFAWARVISQVGAGQFANVWQPPSTGSVADGFRRSVIGLGADTAYNFMQEFLPFTRPHSLRHRR
ncbi:MAG TPA: hypothetical protein VH302_05590 [Bryobacteraceae bacterium]|nr:hypothetical protein [Bryobacteraceae bacterium]